MYWGSQYAPWSLESDFPEKNPSGDGEMTILVSGKHTKSDMENGPVEIVEIPSYITW
jgi:hypothetical protein